MQGNASKTKLVLIELIIIILFFSLAGGVCINIFTQARLLSVKSTDTTQATLVAQSVVEEVRSSSGGLEGLDARYSKTADGYVAYYDTNWNETGDTGARYNMVIRTDRAGGLLVADIVVSRGENEIYSITTKKYTG